MMDNWLQKLNEKGFVRFFNKTEIEAQEIITLIGKTIYTTEVKVNTNSRSLVTSTKKLDVHTDHHKAKYIMWYCIKQTDIGGYTELVDVREIIAKMPVKDIQELKKIHLYEHKVFPDDVDSYPMLQYVENQYLIYYSFWLADKSQKKNKSFEKFRHQINESPKISFQMKPQEILIINNHYILHGRTEIAGNQDRHLRRYWIA